MVNAFEAKVNSGMAFSMVRESMKIIGKRFWTWMGVWVFGLFVKGEVVAAYTRYKITKDVVNEKTNSPLHDTRGYNVPPDAITVKQTGKTGGTAGLRTDAGSKDPVKRSSKTLKHHFRK